MKLHDNVLVLIQKREEDRKEKAEQRKALEEIREELKLLVSK